MNYRCVMVENLEQALRGRYPEWSELGRWWPFSQGSGKGRKRADLSQLTGSLLRVPKSRGTVYCFHLTELVRFCRRGSIVKSRVARRKVIIIISVWAIIGGLAGSAYAAGTWTNAEEIPGFSLLNVGAEIGLPSAALSCSSAGNCGTGGQYLDASNDAQAYVDTESSGSWGDAVEVPGLAAMNLGGNATLVAISCASDGNCSAGGEYAPVEHGNTSIFVVNEVGGVWSNAVPLALPPSTAPKVWPNFRSISCSSAGNCGAVGSYRLRGNDWEVFVATESDGVWAKARTIPGLLNMSSAGTAEASSISCPGRGDCSLAGMYSIKNGLRLFVASEMNGAWGPAREMPGAAAFGSSFDDSPGINAISCSSIGNCSAGGDIGQDAVVDNEVNGSWRDASEVSGLPFGGRVSFLSCAANGDCVASGTREPGPAGPFELPFIANEWRGHWGGAIVVPGIEHVSRFKIAKPSGGGVGGPVSCSTPEFCITVGGYTTAPTDPKATYELESEYVATQVSGKWESAREIPGLAALNLTQSGEDVDTAIACSSGENCSIAGSYTNAANSAENFVAGFSNGP
jgi:hypothetical protein